MKTITRTLAAVIAISSLATTAAAGDWNNGAGPHQGLRGSTATPVPVPVPVQETFNYYFRGDLGIGMMARKPSLSENGMVIGELDLISPLSTSSFAQAHTRSSIGTPATIGIGMYLSPRWRADVTVDAHKKQKADRTGTINYTADLPTTPPTTQTPGGTTIGSTVTGNYSERLSARSTAYMLNGYYDLTDRGRFTPYVGVGLGVVHHNAEREISIPGYTVVEPAPGGTYTVPGATSNGGQSSRHFGLAAALMLGTTYAIDHRTVFDFNYRAMYAQGFDMRTNVTGNFGAGTTGTQTKESRLSVGDTWEHQIRAGIRVNIW